MITKGLQIPFPVSGFRPHAPGSIQDQYNPLKTNEVGQTHPPAHPRHPSRENIFNPCRINGVRVGYGWVQLDKSTVRV